MRRSQFLRLAPRFVIQPTRRNCGAEYRDRRHRDEPQHSEYASGVTLSSNAKSVTSQVSRRTFATRAAWESAMVTPGDDCTEQTVGHRVRKSTTDVVMHVGLWSGVCPLRDPAAETSERHKH